MGEHELDVTERDVLQAWGEAMHMPADMWQHDANTKTIKELAEMFHISINAAEARAKAAIERGEMQQGYIHEALSDGRRCVMKAYRLVSRG